MARIHAGFTHNLGPAFMHPGTLSLKALVSGAWPCGLWSLAPGHLILSPSASIWSAWCPCSWVLAQATGFLAPGTQAHGPLAPDPGLRPLPGPPAPLSPVPKSLAPWLLVGLPPSSSSLLLAFLFAISWTLWDFLVEPPNALAFVLAHGSILVHGSCMGSGKLSVDICVQDELMLSPLQL